jgi:hypothetical protein
VYQTKLGAVGGVHRDRGVQVDAALVAIVAQAGGVLDRQDVPSRHQASGMGAGGGDHFLRRNRLTMLEPPEPHFARAITAQRADADAALPHRNQPGKQVDANLSMAAISESAKRAGHTSGSDYLRSLSSQRYARAASHQMCASGRAWPGHECVREDALSARCKSVPGLVAAQ